MTRLTQPILQLKHLHFSHPGEPALFRGLDLALPAGVNCLAGESGSGKSSLLRLLQGEQPLNGELSLAGKRLVDDPEAHQRKVFWHDPGDDRLDEMQAAEFAAHWQARYPQWDAPAWQDHLDGFGLAPHTRKPLHTLSAGTRRKLWLGAAFSSGAALCLLDEPAAGLDRASVEYLGHVLADPVWETSGRVVLVVSGMALPGVTWASTVTLRA